MQLLKPLKYFDFSRSFVFMAAGRLPAAPVPHTEELTPETEYTLKQDTNIYRSLPKKGFAIPKGILYGTGSRYNDAKKNPSKVKVISTRVINYDGEKYIKVKIIEAGASRAKITRGYLRKEALLTAPRSANEIAKEAQDHIKRRAQAMLEAEKAKKIKKIATRELDDLQNSFSTYQHRDLWWV